MATPNKVSPDLLVEIIDRWNRGESQVEIGAALNLNRGTIASHLRKILGVETPEHWTGTGRVSLGKASIVLAPPPPVIYPDNPPVLSQPYELSPGEFDRFCSKVAPPNERGCCLWLAGAHADGTGIFATINSPSETAYRVAWRLVYGPIPEGMNINHRCDVRACVEPTHLWLGTQAQNLADMAAKGRAVGRHEDRSGENNTTAKLTWERVRKIRRVRETRGLTIKELAVMFGMSTGQICNITTYKQWTDDPLER